ncbi:plasmid pRiA4b ORF-3 family protein [Actinoplanes sp. GCM10030250]|uniref:plasmid pRiA4b ORF-3 family protein n=1 Tax=Actinoplanes sp. GCM10030250 TaxID=3273376 RepID=UPI0036069E65
MKPAVDVPEQCDCPECSDDDFDPEAFVADLSESATALLAVDDPLEGELFGANFLAAGELAGEGFTEALSEGIVPSLTQLSTSGSLAVLLAVDAVDDHAGAGDAARRLMEAGVPAPVWAGELSEPVRIGLSRRYGDPGGEASMLMCSFERSGRSHGFLVHVDHLDCDAAADIILFAGESLENVSTMIQADGLRAGLTLIVEELDPAEFRWQIERALDARAVHDQEDDEPELDDGRDEDGPGYHALSVLLRARMGALPEPPRPPAAHGDNDRPAALEMPVRAKPKKNSDGPAPIYQVKVSLRGSKPPIWRRLELPGDTSLADLHHIIQVAFGWQDSHLHVFETPSGRFGVPDRELGHRAEKPVTLKQVAPRAGSKVGYLYDFGDNWDHEILVEKLLDRRAGPYPQCTGGRRAAPPDDCGGIWGYAELVEILSDPSHPDHKERLEWLGLRSAGDFDPARFDATEVTRALTGRG